MESNISTLPTTGYVREAQLVRQRKHPSHPAVLPFSAATLWRKVRAGEFPKPVKLGPRITAWPVESIREWMAAQGNK
jgi:predicted DNA-binding transcriptional regulator AlpA